jgi:hypothetical protein
MKNLSGALAIVLAYLESRDVHCTEDDDIRTLESVAVVLSEATAAERLAVIQDLNKIGKPELIEGLGLE